MVMPPWSGPEALVAVLGPQRATALTALLRARALAAAEAVAPNPDFADSAAGRADLSAVLRRGG